MARTIEQAVEAAVRAGDVVPTNVGEARVLAALLAAGVQDELAVNAVETYRAAIVGLQQDCYDVATHMADDGGLSANETEARELYERICERAGRGIVEAMLHALDRHEPQLATAPAAQQPAWEQAWRLAEKRMSA
ncbi:MAG TPA: hypothetical protein VGD74_12675 [Vulgatibacter sp.]